MGEVQLLLQQFQQDLLDGRAGVIGEHANVRMLEVGMCNLRVRAGLSCVNCRAA
jgi:hypothetical protein